LKSKWIALIAMAAALAISPVARADSFTFTYTAGGGVSGSGTLDGTFLGPGEWSLTSGSGSFNDGTNSGSIALTANPNAPGSSLSPSTYFTYDDLLFLWAGPGQVLDVDGLLFSFAGLELNLWDTGGGPGTDGWGENNGNSGSGTFTITGASIPPSEVPEPPTLPLLGAGLVGLSIFLVRREKPSVLALNA